MTPATQGSIPIWRDERFWKVAFQIITLAVVIAVLAVLLTNLNRNLAQLGMRFGFRFLSNQAGFSVGENLVNYRPQDPYQMVVFAGLINSLRLIIVGISLATIVGILAGVASFSENWLVYKISRAYVGLVRNVPLLLQLFFWYFAVYFQLPSVQDQLEFGWVVMSKRGIYLPGPSLTDQNWLGFLLLVGAALLGGLLWKLLSDVFKGDRSPRGLIYRGISGLVALGVIGLELWLVIRGVRYLVSPQSDDSGLPLGVGISFLVLAAIAMVAFWLWQKRTRLMVEQGASGQPQLMAIGGLVAAFVLILLFGLGWQLPVVQEGGGASGGLRLSLEYAAALSGLVLYTGAFIAEIVRAGIQSVSKGQWEAARSLGLPSSLAMRLVVFPQSLRVIIPPLNSEYMNLAKNTTLAFAIGYPDLFSVSFTTLNQTGRAVEMIVLIMFIYLIFNLLISVGMNQLNALVQLKER
ncbi:MAG: ABC transporter permease subunit [Leptolyngbya sp. DLM2.Bin15]|nr:MAG: ABC transporter permease subunit [Leptolyngbya sp. DLM2.Bin15]